MPILLYSGNFVRRGSEIMRACNIPVPHAPPRKLREMGDLRESASALLPR